MHVEIKDCGYPGCIRTWMGGSHASGVQGFFLLGWVRDFNYGWTIGNWLLWDQEGGGCCV